MLLGLGLMSLILIPKNLLAVNNELNWLKFISTRARPFSEARTWSFIPLSDYKNIAERFTSKSTKSRRFENSSHVTSQRNPTKLTTWVYCFSRYRFSKRHELKSRERRKLYYCSLKLPNDGTEKTGKRQRGRKSWLFFPLPIIIVWIFSCFHFSLINHRKQREKQIRVKHNRDRVEAFIKNVRKIRSKEAWSDWKFCY